MIRTIISILALTAAIGPILGLLRYRHTVAWLSDLAASDSDNRPRPRLSAIVPARNEASAVRAAVESMFRQDYPDLEIILVDDRSTDGTRQILAGLAAAHPDCARLVNVDTLPSGWLGKPHALWIGAQQATGEWLLFTDADVVFSDLACFRRAVDHAVAEGLDHLALAPRIIARNFWLRAFTACLEFILWAYWRTYLANEPRSRRGMGIGAFNLLRKSAYEAIGGYRSVALRPDDDVRLGMRIKRAGLRQQVLAGTDLLHVEWYPSMGAALRGLEKSLYAGLDYSPTSTAVSVAGIGLLVWPFVTVWIATGWDRWLLLGAVADHAANFLSGYRRMHREVGWRPLSYYVVLPLSLLILVMALVRSAWLAQVRGGIMWRDTFYSLKELREE